MRNWPVVCVGGCVAFGIFRIFPRKGGVYLSDIGVFKDGRWLGNRIFHL